MNSSITGFSPYSILPRENLAGAYSQLKDIYGTYTGGTHNTYKLMALMQAELDKLILKSRSHNSESLKGIIKKKEEALEVLKKFSEDVRKTYFSRGEVAQAKVNANMELFAV